MLRSDDCSSSSLGWARLGTPSACLSCAVLVPVYGRNEGRKTCFFHESCLAMYGTRTKMVRCFAVYSCGLMHLKNVKSQEYTVRDRGNWPCQESTGWPGKALTTGKTLERHSNLELDVYPAIFLLFHPDIRLDVSLPEVVWGKHHSGWFFIALKFPLSMMIKIKSQSIDRFVRREINPFETDNPNWRIVMSMAAAQVLQSTLNPTKHITNPVD